MSNLVGKNVRIKRGWLAIDYFLSEPDDFRIFADMMDGDAIVVDDDSDDATGARGIVCRRGGGGDMWRCDDCGWTNPDKHTPELCKTRQMAEVLRDENMRLRRELERRESGRKVRVYLKRDDGAEHTHVVIHSSELVELLTHEWHPWHVVSAHVVEGDTDASVTSGREGKSDDDSD